ncbi:MAG: sensor histidine kinase [Bacteroidota bacterium]|nr:sensor histidine kinase [Bacteroidota bacterium]
MDELSQKVLIISFLSLFVVLIFVAIVNLILAYQKRQIKFIQEKEHLTSQHENELLHTQLEIQEQTLKNISQEIHDNIGQVLSLVKLNINTMEGQTPETLQDKIEDSRHLISAAIKDLRDLSRSLNTDYIIEAGLEGAVEYEVEMLKRTKAFEIDFQIQGTSYSLEEKQQLILFRIVQEALHNIIKHAMATSIRVILQFQPNYFVIQIIDNGKGFALTPGTESSPQGHGLGLRNMHNRAKIINADFHIHSTIGKGTQVTVNLPLTEKKLSYAENSPRG